MRASSCHTKLVPGILDSHLDYRVGEDVFRVSHSSFFQVNRFLVDRMVELAIGEANGERAFDLYCGAKRSMCVSSQLSA